VQCKAAPPSADHHLEVMVGTRTFDYPLFDRLPTFPPGPNLKETIVLQELHSPAATDTASEAHRHAYNAAFTLLDLSWHWDRVTFARVRPYGRAGVRSWVEAEQSHLLRAYTVDFLVDAIEETKERCLSAYRRQAGKHIGTGADRLAA
jgi:hypothetical protein